MRTKPAAWSLASQTMTICFFGMGNFSHSLDAFSRHSLVSKIISWFGLEEHFLTVCEMEPVCRRVEGCSVCKTLQKLKNVVTFWRCSVLLGIIETSLSVLRWVLFLLWRWSLLKVLSSVYRTGFLLWTVWNRLLEYISAHMVRVFG